MCCGSGLWVHRASSIVIRRGAQRASTDGCRRALREAVYVNVKGLGQAGPPMWKSRERFLDDGIVSERVRPEIALSWVRSRQSGVPAIGDPATRHADFDPHTRLMRLATPILDRLAAEVANADMVVILTDPHGLVLDRRAGTAALRRGPDRVLLAPRDLYAEDSVVTTRAG